MTDKTSNTIELCLLLIGGLLSANISFAQSSERDQRDAQQTRQAEAVSRAVFDKIQQAQSEIDQENNEAAQKILNGLIGTDNLSDYERSQILQYLGILQHNMGNTQAAIGTFEEILLIEGLELQFHKQTVYTLAQFSLAVEQYADAVGYLEQWLTLEPNPGAEQYILYGQSLYQVGRYKDMITPIEAGLDTASSRGTPIKEDWYALLNFAYFQQEDYAKVRDTIKILLANWPRKRYWISIAGAYSELGDETNLVSAYNIAHTQGFLQKESELVTMAQLYIQREVPYKAATLLETEIDAGRVSASAKNYRLLSQAWSMAHEDEKSIPALQQAASMSDDGNLDLRLGNAYLNIGRYADCETAIKIGLKKDGLKDPDYAYISLGMCLYNQKKYDAATGAFENARKTSRSRKIADEWIRVIGLDKQRIETIAEVERKAKRQVQLLADRRADGRGG